MLALVGVLGLLVGSFVNVVVHRVPRHESLLRPASRCTRCGTPIRPWHNVPVLGWLWLRGRCVHCGQPISVRYPLVEMGTAALFVAVAARFGLSPVLPAYLYLAAVAVALAMIDVDVRRLPDAIVLPSYAVGGLLLLVAALAGDAGGGRGGGLAAALRALLAMAALFGGYLALALVVPGGMGFGDVKLAGLLGLFLGWLGWSSVLVGTFAAFALGGLTGVGLLLTRRAGGKTAIPFGPYMLAGALLALFVTQPVARWYASLFPLPA